MPALICSSQCGDSGAYGYVDASSRVVRSSNVPKGFERALLTAIVSATGCFLILVGLLNLASKSFNRIPNVGVAILIDITFHSLRSKNQVLSTHLQQCLTGAPASSCPVLLFLNILNQLDNVIEQLSVCMF